MRNHTQKATVAVILVAILLLSLPLGVKAQESVTSPTESVLSNQTTSETTPETETTAEETTAETEGTAEEDTTAITIRGADPTTAVYQVCDALAQNMEARHLFVFDTNTDKVLYAKTVGNGKLFPASTTKLFSAYVALQYLDPYTVVTAGDELDLVHEGSSLAGLNKGSRLWVTTLVEGMMLPSGNDAALTLAAAAGRVIAQDENLPAADAVDVFVDEMNRKAEEYGFEQSNFTSPDGWHSGAHYTCMNDMARIAKLALQDDTIRRYMRLSKDNVQFLSGHQVVWENNNILLYRDSNYYRGDAVGMKTGYTRPAGYSVMTAFTFEEGEIVIGLFGYTSKNARFLDAIRLIKAVKEQLRLDLLADTSVG